MKPTNSTTDLDLDPQSTANVVERRQGHPQQLLVQLAQGQRLLAEARDLYEVKAVRDFAQSAAALLKQQRLSHAAAMDALELKLLAERRLGELLQHHLNHSRMSEGGNTLLPTIPVGISRIQSYRWQKSATVPEEQFHNYLARCRSRGKDPTTSGVLHLATVHADADRNQNLTGVGELVGSFRELITGGKKFATVYADPPWPYNNQGTRARTGRHYPTLNVDEMARLPVQEVVTANAHLHLWTTNSFLREALDLMAEWGFTYKSVFVWCKPNYGLGNYWRVAHEFLLFGVRGKCPFRDRGQRSWQEFPRGQHSAKPDEVRRLIEKVSPPDYLELFGRKRINGWTVLGNEIA